MKKKTREEYSRRMKGVKGMKGRDRRELGKMILSCSISLLSSEITGWCHATTVLIHWVQKWSLYPAGLQSPLGSAGQRGLQIRMEQVDHPLKGHFTGDGTQTCKGTLKDFRHCLKHCKWWCPLNLWVYLIASVQLQIKFYQCKTSAVSGMFSCQYLRITDHACLSLAALLHQSSNIIQTEIHYERGTDKLLLPL